MDGTELEQQLREVVLSPDNQCFGCGIGNPSGLHLRFERDGEVVRSSFTPGSTHGGWAGVVHGGILATALDEAMAYTLYFHGIKGLTARMEIRYRLAVLQGDELTVEARVARNATRVVDVGGRLVRAGEIVAEATGRFMKMGRLDPEALMQTARMDGQRSDPA